MAKSASKTPAGPSTPVMVNKGLPLMFIFGSLIVLLLAVWGGWSAVSGASNSLTPSFSIFWLLGVILLASAGWMLYKFKVGRGIVLVLLALVAFQVPGTTSGPKLEKGLKAAPAYVAEKGGNLLTTGTTKSAADLAAERKAQADALRLQAELDGTKQASYEKEMAKGAPLTEVAFTTRTAGKFEVLHIKSGTRVGPIYLYKACGLRWTKSGIGIIKILTRPDEKSVPVEAELNDDDYSIKTVKHLGEPEDVFFEATHGDIQIEMIRFDNGTNKENPCA